MRHAYSLLFKSYKGEILAPGLCWANIMHLIPTQNFEIWNP
jgi:hypothetical protein